MVGFITFLHVIACILLVVVILMQSGRGGGLTEGFAAAESMFGAQTNTMMVKATTILATFFLVTSLSLAFLSSKKGQSLVIDQTATEAERVPLGQPAGPADASQQDGKTDNANEPANAQQSQAATDGTTNN